MKPNQSSTNKLQLLAKRLWPANQRLLAHRICCLTKCRSASNQFFDCSLVHLNSVLFQLPWQWGECHFRNFNTESEFWSLTPSRHLILWLKLPHDWLHDRPHDQSTDKEQDKKWFAHFNFRAVSWCNSWLKPDQLFQLLICVSESWNFILVILVL